MQVWGASPGGPAWTPQAHSSPAASSSSSPVHSSTQTMGSALRVLVPGVRSPRLPIPHGQRSPLCPQPPALGPPLPEPVSHLDPRPPAPGISTCVSCGHPPPQNGTDIPDPLSELALSPPRGLMGHGGRTLPSCPTPPAGPLAGPLPPLIGLHPSHGSLPSLTDKPGWRR